MRARRSSRAARGTVVAIVALAAGGATFALVACSTASPAAPPLAESAGDDAAIADATIAERTGDASRADADTVVDANDAGITDAGAIPDAPEDCSAAHEALDQLFDGSTCGACVETKCSNFYSTCTESCTCTTGLDIFFQCLALGGSGSDCQSETLKYLTPGEYAPVYQCKIDCLYACGTLEAGPDE